MHQPKRKVTVPTEMSNAAFGEVFVRNSSVHCQVIGGDLEESEATP